MTEPSSTAPSDTGAASDPVKIKKYANRRLYNTATSSYVTLDHLCQMVKQGTDFVVHDAKTGEDITRSVLTQIIVEEEGKSGQNMLPVSFLRQLISFYGDNLQALVPRYLENSMSAFARNQEQMRTAMSQAFGGMFPFPSSVGAMEEMGKQNLALFQNAMKMWGLAAVPGAEAPASDTSSTAAPAAKAGESIDLLRQQLEAMQSQLEALSKKG
ncbi:MAG: polyhydroxyalkanoate synthesis repressor PhaR [Alphaproteobacteria bacterium]|nr:polyhydroxyalkanoate synthesis repressor PhaR [Alphaproteobacteria bacterium]MBN9498318.1 polyhydroxyalkanoate synthesis repressor PhaR [Alphaproteobacteria bacterium]